MRADTAFAKPEVDDATAKKEYGNRSEAIRDLIRDRLVAEEIDANKVVVGALTIAYDRYRPNLTQKLLEAQHGASSKVLAATHVHLDHHNCPETIIMKRRGGEFRDLANKILSRRGVKHGRLVITTTHGHGFESALGMPACHEAIWPSV